MNLEIIFAWLYFLRYNHGTEENRSQKYQKMYRREPVPKVPKMYCREPVPKVPEKRGKKMINLFFIKNKLKNKQNAQNNNNEILEKYKNIAQKSKDEILKEFTTDAEKGLNDKIVEKRLDEDGDNIVVKEEKHSWFYFFINSFKDKFILILIILAVINQLISNDKIGTIIIFAI